MGRSDNGIKGRSRTVSLIYLISSLSYLVCRRRRRKRISMTTSVPPMAQRRRTYQIPSFFFRRTFVNARVKWVRDGSLDLVVSKEKHLRPFHALKDLLFSRRQRCLPISVIAEKRDELDLPFRAIRFIRKYPSAFTESSTFVRPTQQLSLLHQEEQEAYSSSRCQSAERLARVLMMTRRRRLPIKLVDRLAFDLGIPFDYVRTLLSYYPDYFDVVASSDDGNCTGELDLELVCWNKDLAVSKMEKDAMSRFCGYRKGMPLEFQLRFPPGFDLDKRVSKWMEEFQKLPYVSPYEDGTVHDPKSAVIEKWTVGVLHELLHLLVSKKTAKENLLLLGEHIGLPIGFNKVFNRYPGIFYISNKIRTQTIVLRECYKRDMLMEKNPVMGMRYRYIYLMRKSVETHSGSGCEHVGANGAVEEGREDHSADDEPEKVGSSDSVNDEDGDFPQLPT